jgi:hypothetical protein
MLSQEQISLNRPTKRLVTTSGKQDVRCSVLIWKTWNGTFLLLLLSFSFSFAFPFRTPSSDRRNRSSAASPLNWDLLLISSSCIQLTGADGVLQIRQQQATIWQGHRQIQSLMPVWKHLSRARPKINWIMTLLYLLF